MDSLEILKQELLSQKDEIVSKGGTVTVASVNPSPSEITAGIKTIIVPDLTGATATVEDVILGKTFYSGNGTIKTGTKEIPDLTIADALEEDVELGKTFYAGDNIIKTGTKVVPDLTEADAEENNVEYGKKFYSQTNEIRTGSRVIPDLGTADAVEEDVVAGKTFFSGDNEIKTGTKIVPDLNLADAVAEDVVLGKTFYAGDNSIKTGTKTETDFTIATATVEDVAQGKTFYAGDKTLKTGTSVGGSSEDLDLAYTLFLADDISSDVQFNFTIPDGVKNLKKYLLSNSAKRVNITFNTDLEVIGMYAFYNSPNITFENFHELQKLKYIGSYSFFGPKVTMSLETLSPVLEEMQTRAFYNSVRPNTDITLPKTLATIGNYAMTALSKTEMKSLNIPDDLEYKSYGINIFNNLIFDCDLVFPHSLTSVPNSFLFGASCNNIILHENITSVGSNAFSFSTVDANSDRRLKTVTFLGETPPTFSSNPFAQQDKANNFKIYVPDNSVDEYKTALSDFSDYIYPLSQKD